MKMMKLLAVGAAVVLVLTSAVYVNQHQAAKHKPVNFNTGNGFAVLELFTSEGCSSCPPADELMSRIQKEAGNKPVYVLAYHVDYWDRLGWKDVFSNPGFSKRQYWYNRKFTSQVYTPQLILNGKTEFVGSDEGQIRTAVTASLNGKSASELILQARQTGSALHMTYEVEGRPVRGNLVVALVQKHAVSQIKAGENDGRTLTHVQIVREFQTFALNPQGQGTKDISIPTEFNTNDWEIIGFIQNPDTGEITAAAKTLVSSGSAGL